MTTAALKASLLSKRRAAKGKRVKIHAKNAANRREYDDFQSAIEDVASGRIERLNVETLAGEIKQEIRKEG
ncbi:MAG: hypothetical protein ACHQNE_09385 [Candidatus Kapaibacterium sp.]